MRPMLDTHKNGDQITAEIFDTTTGSLFSLWDICMSMGEKETRECSQNRKTDQLIFTSSQCQCLCCGVQMMP